MTLVMRHFSGRVGKDKGPIQKGSPGDQGEKPETGSDTE